MSAKGERYPADEPGMKPPRRARGVYSFEVWKGIWAGINGGVSCDTLLPLASRAF